MSNHVEREALTVAAGIGPVYLVSDNLDRATEEQVTDLEAELGVRLPAGYTAYATTLGWGLFGGYVRIFLPYRVRRELPAARSRWSGSSHWNYDALSRERLRECLPIGDTTEGDSLVFHPARRDEIFVLPRHDPHIRLIGSTVDEAVTWLCESGVLTTPIPFRYFESLKDRAVQRFGGRGSEVDFEDLYSSLRENPLAGHGDFDDEEGFFQVFVGAIWGYVNGFLQADDTIAVHIHFDHARQNDAFSQLVSRLQHHGLQGHDT